ncbi:MAG: glycosyltransferase family 4 protein [Verrucomicrobia bacterium]|nr:glycosyltransferase family 4 protein [Verrucomicrobiota bacterium]
MRLVFINRFYWPDEPATAQLLTDLAEALPHRGHEVTVIASHPGSPGVPRAETRRGVRILRVRTPRRLLPGVAGKALAYLTFFIGALWRAVWTVRGGDALVALTDPPLIGVGAWLVAGVRGARLVHWAQDIYPEIAITLAGQRWLRVLKPLRNLAWRRADACITLGTDMASVLAAAGVEPARLHLSPNWAPAGLVPQPAAIAAPLRDTWGLTGKFVVAYSGNLGRVHDLFPVLAVAAELRDDPGIAFVFIGHGAQRRALEAEAAQRGLVNVQFRPPQPRAALAATLTLGDVHLVTMLPGCETLVFPSKLYGIAAVARPVLVIAPAGCELARIVTAEDFGRAFTRDEPAAIAAALRALRADPALCTRLGQAAARFSGANGDQIAADRWESALAAAGVC